MRDRRARPQQKTSSVGDFKLRLVKETIRQVNSSGATAWPMPTEVLFGYMGQLAIFGTVPDGATLSGVALLIGSVLATTMSTLRRAKTEADSEEHSQSELNASEVLWLHRCWGS